MFKKGDKAKVKASQEDLDFIGVWDSIKDGDIVTIEGQEENALWNNPKFDNKPTYVADGWIIPSELLCKIK